MRDVPRALLLLIALGGVSACRQIPAEQNIATENGSVIPADIEALPADESDATPANELATGDDEASNVDQPTNTD
jgi:hypothetical protein